MKITRNTKLNAIMLGRKDSNILLSSQNLNMTFAEYITATASMSPEAVDTLLDLLNTNFTEVKSVKSDGHTFRLIKPNTDSLFGSIVVLT